MKSTVSLHSRYERKQTSRLFLVEVIEVRAALKLSEELGLRFHLPIFHFWGLGQVTCSESHLLEGGYSCPSHRVGTEIACNFEKVLCKL